VNRRGVLVLGLALVAAACGRRGSPRRPKDKDKDDDDDEARTGRPPPPEFEQKDDE